MLVILKIVPTQHDMYLSLFCWDYAQISTHIEILHLDDTSVENTLLFEKQKT